MKYLLWLARVKQYIESNYAEFESWESWAIWREEFLANKSATTAATDVYERRNSEI